MRVIGSCEMAHFGTGLRGRCTSVVFPTLWGRASWRFLSLADRDEPTYFGDRPASERRQNLECHGYGGRDA